MLRPGAPERPKEGVYLAATLAVMGEQLDERIDELARRRRLRARVGVTALAVCAVASGGVAAVALSAAAPELPAPAALTAEHELRCVDGDAVGDDAYFTVRYRLGEDEPPAEAVRLCALARSAVEARFDEFGSATPAQLIEIAEDLVAQALTRTGTDAVPAVAVDDAAFRPLAHPDPATPIVCEREGSTVVLAVPGGAASAVGRSLLCARAGS